MRAAPLLGVLLPCLLAAGCGPAPYTIDGPPEVSVPEEGPPDKWIPSGLPRPNPFTEHAVWAGEYDCAQGRTTLRLRVVEAHDQHVRAVFDFHHVPSGAAGRFLVGGVFDEHTGNVRLTPGAWIEQPPDYVTVGMMGRASFDGTRFRGRILGPGCGGFWLNAVP
jgi:hypothetical protein